MKKRNTRIISAILACILLVSLIPAVKVSATNDTSIRELPDVYTESSGSFTITANSRFLLVSSSEPTAEQKEFAQFISQQFAGAGLPSSNTLPIVWGPESYKKSGDIVLMFDSNLAAEGYKIVVDSDNITITGADKRGQMYGAFMVIKTMRANGSATISGCTIQDTPDAEERAVLLDCGRKYFTAEWIKNYIKEMAYMGYNTIEIHFAEDQGIRLDIWDENFTSANGNDFSWICGGMMFDSYNNMAIAVNGSGYIYEDVDKYLTSAEMVEILDVAKQYQIDVIPSYDTPMHCQYLRRIWAAHVGGAIASEITRYEPYTDINTNYTFNFNGKTYSKNGITENGVLTAYNSYGSWNNIMVKNDDGERSGTKTIDVTNPVGRYLMEAILEDYAKFFKEHGCTEFNICADEVAFYELDGWATYAKNVLGVTNGTKYDTYTHYINEITNLLQDEYGYSVRMYNDFVDRNGTGNYAQHLTFDKDLEIVYWTLPQSTSGVQKVSTLVNKGYKIYNAVENYNYYVLNRYASANNTDDRAGVRPAWTHISAENLWNYWNPTVFVHPTKGTGENISAANVDGGYFLIWTDCGGLCTESQIWNGMDSKGTYNVIERMWSNVTKMWNYDVNSSLSYANYAALRNKLGDFPGYAGDCTVENTLPTAKAVTRAYLADHSELTALLAKKFTEDEYTKESWNNYQTVRAAAAEVDANYDATQTQVNEAVANLQAAIKALTDKPFEVTVYHKTTVGTKEHLIATTTLDVTAGVPFTREIPGRPGYDLVSVENCNFIPYSSGADGGYITGYFTSAAEITIWYTNMPETKQLDSLLDASYDSSVYTPETWSAYTVAVANAEKFLSGISASPSSSTYQEKIQEYVDAILAARNNLASATTVEETKILDLKVPASTVAKGKKAILIITTTTDVSGITVDGVAELTDHYSQPAVANGQAVKLWYVTFRVTETRTYTVRAGSAAETVEITCK